MLEIVRVVCRQRRLRRKLAGRDVVSENYEICFNRSKSGIEVSVPHTSGRASSAGWAKVIAARSKGGKIKQMRMLHARESKDAVRRRLPNRKIACAKKPGAAK
jgi:hypothetical protein